MLESSRLRRENVSAYAITYKRAKTKRRKSILSKKSINKIAKFTTYCRDVLHCLAPHRCHMPFGFNLGRFNVKDKRRCRSYREFCIESLSTFFL